MITLLGENNVTAELGESQPWPVALIGPNFYDSATIFLFKFVFPSNGYTTLNLPCMSALETPNYEKEKLLISPFSQHLRLRLKKYKIKCKHEELIQ